MNNIRAMMKNAKITQKELAKKVGISVPTICHYVNESTQPTLDVYMRIAKECGYELVCRKIKAGGRE